jgi:hypothetical protein
MKNLSFLSIALLTFCILFFSACKKDDELSTRDKLIGKWNYESFKYEEYEDGQLVDSGSETIGGSTIEFKDNGTFISSFTDEDGNTDSDTGTWSVDGNNLITGEADDIQTIEIQEITTTKMVLVFDDEDNYDGTTYRYRDEITFKKQ